MDEYSLDNLDIDSLSNLSVKEANKIRVKYINHLPLEVIPFTLLPPTHETDYYFVSYSHKDYKKVYEDIFLLEEAGLSIWYDRGIPAGKDWKKTANNFMVPFECKGILFYISESSLSSPAVLDEMLYSLQLEKPFIAIHLPFESDYLYQGKSVKGKIYPVSKMLEIMVSNGANIEEEVIEKIKEIFPDEMIYLPFSMPVSNKVEKIRRFLPEPPMFTYDETTRTILSLNNPNAVIIGEKDFPIDVDESSSYQSYSLADCCFANAERLEHVTFPQGLHLLFSGKYTFHNCTKLRYIEGLGLGQLAEEGLFQNCASLECIELSDYLLKADDNAFKGCSNLEFEDERFFSSLGYIGVEAFAECNHIHHFESDRCIYKIGHIAFRNCMGLTYVRLKEAEEIGKNPFAGCENLIEIILENESDQYLTLDGVLYKKKEDGLILVSYPLGINNITLVPECKTIGDSVFAFLKGIKRIEIPEGIECLQSGCFLKSISLEEIYLPSTLKEIQFMCFYGCKNLKHIYLNMTVKQAKGILFKPKNNLDITSKSMIIRELIDTISHIDCLDGKLPIEELI